MAQIATTLGDLDFFHCSQPVRAEANKKKVFANGRLISCLGHKNNEHLMPNPTPPPQCIPHTAAIMSASKRLVHAGGILVGRIGDPVGPNCTAVQTGAFAKPVFAG